MLGLWGAPLLLKKILTMLEEIQHLIYMKDLLVERWKGEYRESMLRWKIIRLNINQQWWNLKVN